MTYLKGPGSSTSHVGTAWPQQPRQVLLGENKNSGRLYSNAQEHKGAVLATAQAQQAMTKSLPSLACDTCSAARGGAPATIPAAAFA